MRCVPTCRAWLGSAQARLDVAQDRTVTIDCNWQEFSFDVVKGRIAVGRGAELEFRNCRIQNFEFQDNAAPGSLGATQRLTSSFVGLSGCAVRCQCPALVPLAVREVAGSHTQWCALQSLPSVVTLVQALVGDGSARLGEAVVAESGKGSAVWWADGAFSLDHRDFSYAVSNSTIYCGGPEAERYALQAYATGVEEGVVLELGAAEAASRRRRRRSVARWLAPLVVIGGALPCPPSSRGPWLTPVGVAISICLLYPRHAVSTRLPVTLATVGVTHAVCVQCWAR